jgi:hypothetical protein
VTASSSSNRASAHLSNRWYTPDRNCRRRLKVAGSIMAHPTGQNRLPSRNRDYLYIRDGKLQAIRLGRTQAGYRIRASAVELFLSGSKQFELSGEDRDPKGLAATAV